MKLITFYINNCLSLCYNSRCEFISIWFIRVLYSTVYTQELFCNIIKNSISTNIFINNVKQ